MNKKFFIFLLLLVILCIGFFAWKNKGTSSQASVPDLETQYQELNKQYSLKYMSASDAIRAFKDATDQKMAPVRIATYVPGKLPREDGDPYFIGRGVINQSNNDCIVGYMNLVTGITESHHDVCVIYD